MSPKLKILLLKLVLLVSVSARSTKKIKWAEDILPASDVQKNFIVQSVCKIDLALYLDFNEDKMENCTKKFGWNMDEDRSGLEVRSRTASTITVEVPPSDRYQIVLLIPYPIDDNPYSAIYNIYEKNSKELSMLDVVPGTSYNIYSTVLDEGATPVVWHRESYQEAPEKREYELQVDVTSGTDGLLTWNQMSETTEAPDSEESTRKETILEMSSIENSTPNELILEGEYPKELMLQYLQQQNITPETTEPEDSTDESTTEKPEDLPKAYISIEKETDYKGVDKVNLQSEDEDDKWTVHVWWDKPQHPVDSYELILYAENTTTSTVVPGNMTSAEYRDVVGQNGHSYVVSVITNIGNESWHNSGKAIFIRQSTGGAGGRVWAWAGAMAAVWAAVAAAAALYWRLRTCTTSAIKHTAMDKREYDKKDPTQHDSIIIETARIESTVPDAWEIKQDRLRLHEVIGEGAFGVVRRGTLAPAGKEVAVKMLKDIPSMEERRAFLVEMEVMKSVGVHPHVVSLVGCCTAPRAALVAEYCSRGDLLNLLRCSWDVMVSKRNANYYNNNINTAEYRNDLFKGKVPQEHSRLVVNKMYDLQGVCDIELTPLDLLSFCRQIAMGMEFLALNKVVHRDLAARNILVTRDRTLKIADFGLSRDVYEENQYKQKGNCKLPVKWMALESLTRRIYTTASDVWSFGVVMWEVVTVGGAPYAGVATARLPRLLRAGYRMPRPPNCTHHMYDLMRSCWEARPRDRPTFAELHAKLDELLKTASADEYLSLELDDEPPPPTPKAHRYFRMIMRAKRNWNRGESYERPLKAPKNHYSSSPVIYKKALGYNSS